MTVAIQAVGWIEAIAFAFLGVVTLVDWLRHRDRQRQYLALAIGLLAIVTLAGRVTAVTGQQYRLLSIVTVPLFLGSGYALILFRHSFIPVRRRTLMALFALVVIVSAGLDALPFNSNPNVQPPPLEYAAALGFIFLWCGFIIEPVVRFWLASRHRPVVQRARLRALCLGYGGIVAVIVVAIGVAVGAGPSSAQNQVYQLVLGLVVLGVIPMLYVSFAPPWWLRRLWRDREETAFRVATSDLLVVQDPRLLAERALDWAIRLTGADVGLIAGPGGELLAAVNLDPGAAERLLALDPGTRPRLIEIGGDRRSGGVAMVAPLLAPNAAGLVAVIAGAFTPVFGADELARLGEYGVSIGAALDRVRLVEALARERERHESLLAAVSDLGDGLVVTHGRDVAYVNAAYCAITGYDAEEITRAGIPVDVIAAEPPRSMEADDPDAERGAPDHFETTVIAKSGHLVDVEISRRRRGTGAFAQTTAIVRDVSELRRAEARFRGLLDAAPDAFVGTDHGGRIVLVNAAAEQLFGWSREQLLGAPVDQLMASADGSHSIIRKDGALVPVEVSVASIDTSGDSIVLAAIRDVSERRRSADELSRRAFELERSNDALQEFAYVASHDLQEPLRMVASYLQLLRARYGGNFDKDADEFIEYAVDGARRMQALINDLLSYSRVGTQGEPMEPVELSEVMTTAIANLRASIDDTGARVSMGELPAVVADRSQMVQVFQNLIANAIKFHGERIPEVRVEAERRGSGWAIAVRDNGIGIEPRHADRIFMIFKRLHPASDYPGTGIGLSICRKIVERHGGSIWVESIPREGTTFHFTIPDRQPDERADAQMSEPSRRRRIPTDADITWASERIAG